VWLGSKFSASGEIVFLAMNKKDRKYLFFMGGNE
jgi:hypothetical protein